MASATKERIATKRLGVLDPNALYMAEALTDIAGIGPATRAEMRASGIVKPLPQGRTTWYRGSEVIAWIESQAGK